VIAAGAHRDDVDLLGRRIIDRQHRPGLGVGQGIIFGVCRRAVLAPGRFGAFLIDRRHPHPALAVHLVGMDAGIGLVPIGPIQRRNRHRHVRHRLGIEHLQIPAQRAHAIDRAAGIDTRIAMIAGDLVVDIMAGAPILDRHHDVALDPFGPFRRHCRCRAGGDPVGPIGIHLEAPAAAEAGHVVLHLRRQKRAVGADRLVVGPRHLDARGPGLDAVAADRQLARRLVAELMAEHAVLFHVVQPVLLSQHRRGDAVALRPGAGEIAFRRRVQHRVPIGRRVILRRVLRRRSNRRGEVDMGAGRRIHRGGIDQPVTAHP
jgi:hypothetical protein